MDFVSFGIGSLLHSDGQATGVVRIDATLASRLGGPGDSSIEKVHEVVVFLALLGIRKRRGAHVHRASRDGGEDEVEIHLPHVHLESENSRGGTNEVYFVANDLALGVLKLRRGIRGVGTHGEGSALRDGCGDELRQRLIFCGLDLFPSLRIAEFLIGYTRGQHRG